jgi:TolB-like protein
MILSNSARRFLLLASAAAVLGAAFLLLRPAPPANAVAIVPARWTFIDPSGLHPADEILAEAVVSQVARRGKINLIAWPKIRPFRQNPKQSPELARATGASLVLALSVRQTGVQFRVTAFLVEPFTGRSRWAEDFYAQELSSFQTLAESIAQDLEITLGAAH